MVGYTRNEQLICSEEKGNADERDKIKGERSDLACVVEFDYEDTLLRYLLILDYQRDKENP